MNHLLRPEVALRDRLVAEIEQNTYCIFAVAYMDIAGVEAVAEAISRRMDGARFSVRVLFRGRDLATDPAAIERLRQLSKVGRGTLAVRWSRARKFHAKAFGFRRTRTARPTVLVGSANLLGGALATDSGELGVSLSSSGLADDAWEALEAFWEQGQDVTPGWLEEYARRYKRRQQKLKAARAEEDAWTKRFPATKRLVRRRSLAGEPLFLDHVRPISREERKMVENAIKYTTATSDVEVPDDWVKCAGQADAFATPDRRNILLLNWFSADHSSIGTREISIVRLTRRLSVQSPKGKRIWLIHFAPMRGMRLRLRKVDRLRSERVLRRRGLSWKALWSMNSGYLRGRRKRLCAAIRDLGLKLE
jgi:hypothetical protein